MSGTENDALTEKLRSVLSSPDSMAKIQALAGSLGMGDLPFSLPEPSGDAGGKPPGPEPPPAAPALPSGLDTSLLTKLAPLLNGVGKDNQDTRLLRALRPYLHGEREKRLDEAIRLQQMAPLLQMLGGKEGT